MKATEPPRRQERQGKAGEISGMTTKFCWTLNNTLTLIALHARLQISDS
jgi:hypothetical protein